MDSTCEHPKEELQKPGHCISLFSSHEFMTHLVHKEQSLVHVEKPNGLRKPVHSIFISPSQEFVTYLVHKEHLGFILKHQISSFTNPVQSIFGPKGWVGIECRLKIFS